MFPANWTASGNRSAFHVSKMTRCFAALSASHWSCSWCAASHARGREVDDGCGGWRPNAAVAAEKRERNERRRIIDSSRMYLLKIRHGFGEHLVQRYDQNQERIRFLVQRS